MCKAFRVNENMVSDTCELSVRQGFQFISYFENWWSMCRFVHKQMKKLLVKILVLMRRFPKQPHPKSEKDRTRHDIDDKNNALIEDFAEAGSKIGDG